MNYGSCHVCNLEAMQTEYDNRLLDRETERQQRYRSVCRATDINSGTALCAEPQT